MTTQPTTTKEALEPCPFCGDKLIEVAGNEWEEDFRARCIGCLASSGRWRAKAEAIKAWNSRVSAPIVAPEVDLNLRKDEIALLINYNLERLAKAQCDESARNYRKRVQRLREFYEN